MRGGNILKANKNISTNEDLRVDFFFQHQDVIVVLNQSVKQGAQMLRSEGRKGDVKCFYLLAVSQFTEKCFFHFW